MKALRYFPIAILFLLFAGSSCKKEKKDSTPPVISMSSPAEGSHFSMFDTIHIAATFSDDNQLTRTEVSLRDLNGSPVQNSFAINLSGKSYHLHEEMPLYEFRLTSGEYNLEITVSDGENVTTKTTRINITESPTVKKGFYFVTKNGSQHSYSKLDTNYAATTNINQTGTYVGSAITNYHQLLYAASSPNQVFKALNISNNTTKWSLPNHSAGTTFTACDGDGKNVFLGKDDGNVYKYNQDGNSIRSYMSGELTYYVKNVYSCGDYLAVCIADFGSSLKKTIVFHGSSGVVKKVIANTELKGAFTKSYDELYLVSNNQSGKAVIEVLTISSGALNEVLDLGSYTVTSACQVSPDVVLVGTSQNKVYYYKYSTGTYMAVLNATLATKMSYSSYFNKVYLSSFKNFYTYNISPFALTQESFHAHADTIVDFQVLFNK